MSLIISILGILITIFLVIGVHELGHFLVARLCGIKVLRFSIGFGKPLFRWYDKQGTEYMLAAIPLGGYVKMVDENEEEVPPSEVKYAYNRQSFFKKFAVVVAGPLANLLFAFFLYWLLFVIGFTTVKPIIGEILPNSIAARAGLQAQHEIIRIDQDPTMSWYSVMIKILERAGNTGTMSIETQPINTQNISEYQLDLSTWKMDELKPDPLRSLGLEPYSPAIPPIIDVIKSNSPAEKAGLKTGDKIISIGAQPIKDWSDIIKIVISVPEQTIKFEILRNNQSIVIPVTVGTQQQFFKKYGFLGILPKAEIPSILLREQKYNVIDALPQAYYQTKMFTQMNLIMIGKLIEGKISLKSLGGPITIFETAGKSLNSGIIPFMSFLAFLSISIGVINIFPIPGLDGGHVLFQVIELIIRRPLPLRLQLLLYRLGLIVLMLLIIQAVTNDILRL